jgi:multiple sugar transport system substrate-binding protein
MTSSLSRRMFLRTFALGAGGVLLAACQPKVVEVEKIVKETIVVKEEVEREVTREIERQVEKIITLAPASKDPVTLTVHCRLGDQSGHFEERGKAFETEHPWVTVKQQPVAGGDAEYFAKVQANFATGQLGDVFWASIGRSGFYYLAANAILRALDDLVDRDKYDLGQYYTTATEVLRLNGTLYGLPWIIHHGRSAVMVNVDLFKEAGVDVPTLDWTYSDCLEVSKALTKEPDQWGLSFSLGQADDFLMYVVHAIAFGSHVLNPAGDTCILDSQENMEALWYLYDFYHKHKAGPSPAAATEGSWNMWTAGRLAMMQTGYWGRIAAELVKESENPFESAALLLPYGPAGVRGSMYENDPVCMNAETKHIDESWELLKFMTTRETGVLAANDARVPGGRPDVWAADELMSDPQHRVMKLSMEEATPFLGPSNFRGDEMNDVMSQTLAPIWIGDKNPDEQVPVALEAIQAVLDKPQPAKL